MSDRPSDRIDKAGMCTNQEAGMLSQIKAELDSLSASQLRADKFLGVMARMWASPDSSGDFAVAARAYLATPESQSQTAGESQVWPMVYGDFYATIRMLEVFAPADPFVTGLQTKLGEMTAKLYPGANTIGQHMAGQVQRVEDMRMATPPQPKQCYPFSTETCDRPGCTCRAEKAAASASETAENIASRMAKTLDDWLTKTGNRESFNIQKWIRDALTTYAKAERDALKLRAENAERAHREVIEDNDKLRRELKDARDTKAHALAPASGDAEEWAAQVLGWDEMYGCLTLQHAPGVKTIVRGRPSYATTQALATILRSYASAQLAKVAGLKKEKAELSKEVDASRVKPAKFEQVLEGRL